MPEKRSPSRPGAALSLANDAELSMLADAVYGSRDDLISAKSGLGHKEYDLPLNWSLLGDDEGRQPYNFWYDRRSGLTTLVFELGGDSDSRLVISFRGSDETRDWVGPNPRLAADGELL